MISTRFPYRNIFYPWCFPPVLHNSGCFSCKFSIFFAGAMWSERGECSLTKSGARKALRLATGRRTRRVGSARRDAVRFRRRRKANGNAAQCAGPTRAGCARRLLRSLGNGIPVAQAHEPISFPQPRCGELVRRVLRQGRRVCKPRVAGCKNHRSWKALLHGRFRA